MTDDTHLWIVVVGGAFAFFAAMGIGANDAANAFATAVGSRALKMKHAVTMAALCETSGAILMGGQVSETIRKGIADYRCFESQPELLMYGCMWVVLSVGIWLFMASYFEMPVSTTHSCVGGMIGMTWALRGSGCVIWYAPTNTFPYVGGVSGIVLSWFLSPMFSCLIAVFIYSTIRSIVLRHPYESKRIYVIYPVLVGSTVTLNVFFIIYKGAKGLGLHNTDIVVAVCSAFGSGLVCSCCMLPLIPRLRASIDEHYGDVDPATMVATNQVLPAENIQFDAVHNDVDLGHLAKVSSDETELRRITALHETAEKFDIRTEESFKYLQVFTAMCDSFSHGANDVANAIGPFAAIYTIYQAGDVRKNSVMDENAYWILLLGGCGISLGLLVYGYKIIYAIGTKLCRITPARGVAIELSSAIIVITGSRLKIPLSTTHCQIGATVGVGMLENTNTCAGINCRMLTKTMVGWLITCFVVGSTTSVLILQGVHSPSIHGRCHNYSISN